MPYYSREPRIGPIHSHRMRRSELCREPPRRGHATERLCPLHAIHRRRHERGMADRNARHRCMTRSAAAHQPQSAIQESLRRPRAVKADRPLARIDPTVTHQSNRALLGAMGRVCSRRRRRSRAWRARDVSNYGAVTPPRRGPRPHASAEEPLPQYSVPYASRHPRIGPNHSHRMRRSELCRGANGRGHATERIPPLT